MSKLLFQSNKDIPDDMLLGYMFFQKTPSEIKVDEPTLLTLMQKANLPEYYVRKISRSDAFRRATTEIKQTITIQGNGIQSEALVEVTQVAQDNNQIVRLLGRKLIDSNKQEVDYETVGRIEYDKKSGSMMTAVNPAYAMEYDYRQILSDAEKRFAVYADYHNRETIKNMTLRIVKDMAPIALLDSGVAKFIPIKYKDNLYCLQELICLLNPYGASDGAFEIIPVMDTEEQRDLINRQANLSITEEVTDLMASLSETLKSKGSLTVNSAKSYMDKFLKLKQVIEDYQETIQCLFPILTAQVEKAMLHVEENTDNGQPDIIDVNAVSFKDLQEALEV